MNERRRARVVAAATVACFLVGWLALAPSYGPTWDAVVGEYGGGERILAYLGTGDAAYLDLAAAEPRPPASRAPHPDFPHGGFALHQVSTLNSVASALACRVFWTGLGWMSAVVAHHLAIAFFVAVLLFVLVRFVTARFGVVAGIGSAAFLCLAPRFHAHAFNNLKDVPVACLYALAVFACFGAMRTGRLRTWGVAGAVTALALASKANALFLPFHVLVVWAICQVVPSTRGRLRIAPRGVAIASLAFVVAYFAVSPDLWQGPIEAVRARFGAIMEVGKSESSGVSLHGLEHVVWTTPPLMLLFAVLGCSRQDVALDERVLVTASLAFPIGRTLMPGMVNFDGVRHFLEFYPFLAVAAGLGLARLADLVGRRVTPRLAVAAAVAGLVPSLWATAVTHPNGICYFNVLVGGLGGAQARGVPDATDYWGNSYWQGLEWLAAHADRDAYVVVPVAGFIVEAAAPVKLRSDLVLVTGERPVAFDRPAYVMYVTREGGYGPFARVVARQFEPVHRIDVQGGTILEVVRLDPASARDVEAFAVWQRRHDATRAHAALGAWLQQHPDRVDEVALLLAALRTDERSRAEARLREIFAGDLDEWIDTILWFSSTK